MRPAFDWERGAVGAPEHFILHMRVRPVQECLVNPAFCRRKRRFIRVLVVNQLVHILADQLVGLPVAQHPDA